MIALWDISLWITTEEAFIINAELEPGGTYILHEKTAPVGYLPAEDISFTVSSDGSLDEIVMKDAPTEVSIVRFTYTSVYLLLSRKLLW